MAENARPRLRLPVVIIIGALFIIWPILMSYIRGRGAGSSEGVVQTKTQATREYSWDPISAPIFEAESIGESSGNLTNTGSARSTLRNEPSIDPRRRLKVYRNALERLMDCLNREEKTKLYDLFSDELRSVYPFERLSRHADTILQRRGLLIEQGSLRFTGDLAHVRVKGQRGEWAVKLKLDSSGRILGFRFDEPPSSRLFPSRNSFRLSLPFEGKWFVASGGNDASQNEHAASEFLCESQAADFQMRDGSMKSYHGQGTRNEDYLSFDQPVLAPADGEVATVIDGVPENVPGKVNPFAAAGNSVVIRHAPGEYSAILHLRPRRIAVKVGDRVAAGQTIGRCGNSGNSRAPHIHLQLMSSDVPIDALGIQACFHRVWRSRKGDADATLSEDYTPQSGDTIWSESANTGSSR